MNLPLNSLHSSASALLRRLDEAPYSPNRSSRNPDPSSGVIRHQELSTRSHEGSRNLSQMFVSDHGARHSHCVDCSAALHAWNPRPQSPVSRREDRLDPFHQYWCERWDEDALRWNEVRKHHQGLQERWSADDLRWAEVQRRLDVLSSDMLQHVERKLGESMTKLKDDLSLEIRKLYREPSREVQQTTQFVDVRDLVASELQKFSLSLHVAQAQQVIDPLKSIADEVAALRLELLRVGGEAERTDVPRIPLDLIRKVAEIECQGNIKVNLSPEATVNIKMNSVDLVKPMDFVPRTQADGISAEFVNPQAVEPILYDLAELCKLFVVPFTIQGHTKSPAKGGHSSFLEKLGQKRAELIMQQLQNKGVPTNMMTAESMPGAKGLNKACVHIQF